MDSRITRALITFGGFVGATAVTLWVESLEPEPAVLFSVAATAYLVVAMFAWRHRWTAAWTAFWKPPGSPVVPPRDLVAEGHERFYRKQIRHVVQDLLDSHIKPTFTAACDIVAARTNVLRSEPEHATKELVRLVSLALNDANAQAGKLNVTVGRSMQDAPEESKPTTDDLLEALCALLTHYGRVVDIMSGIVLWCFASAMERTAITAWYEAHTKLRAALRRTIEIDGFTCLRTLPGTLLEEPAPSDSPEQRAQLLASVWQDSQTGFEKLDSDIEASWDKMLDTGEVQWTLLGGTAESRYACDIRAKLAGEQVRRSTFAVAAFPRIVADPDPASRWFRTVQLLVPEIAVRGSRSEGHSLGRVHVGGTIPEIGRASALACARLAANELNADRSLTFELA